MSGRTNCKKMIREEETRIINLGNGYIQKCPEIYVLPAFFCYVLPATDTGSRLQLHSARVKRVCISPKFGSLLCG